MAANTLQVLGTNADDDINVIGTAANSYTISVNGGPAIATTNSGALTINSLAGDDDIDINVNALALAGLIVNGSDSTASGGDTLTVAGLVANWTPNAVDGGTLNVDAQVITVQNTEALAFDGENGGATLQVTGAGQFVHTPGNTIDAGHVGLENLLGINYTTLGTAGTVTASGTGAADTLVANGTNASDVIAVTFPAVNSVDIDLSSSLGTHIDLLSLGVENYEINGLEGDDDINVTGGVNATGGAESFLVFGGGPGAGSDTLNLIGVVADGAQTVAVRPDAIESDDQDVAGFGTEIDAIGVELISYTGAGTDDRLNVELGSGDNVARVGRGVGADLVTSDSLPNIEFAGLQFFQILGQAGNDVVTFNTWFWRVPSTRTMNSTAVRPTP